ncbi:hypothetical protein [Microbacterium marinilacus]|uniref:Uncharacterized protein n=1 Tax=Microbacterium marinilacus TaxID=415209 RepID=A0ABP7BNW4_9MICO|nr:hypothetical protein [Microbacterium marinilacus]MBY0688380.1 hypothetical protein [Microbacterium marinilacus]
MRHGPLHTVPDGVAIAAPEGLHLRLTTSGVSHRRGEEQLAAFRWDDLSDIDLRLPGSWLPWPGALATLGYAVLTFLSQQVEAPQDDESRVRLVLTDGTIHDVGVHHSIGGYNRRALAVAQRLVSRLARDPEARTLLRQPDEILRRYVRSVRRFVLA